MPGISGQFFKNFGLTVVVAVLMSLAVARLITPMIAAYFLKATARPAWRGPDDGRLHARAALDAARNRWAAIGIGVLRASLLTIVVASTTHCPIDLPARRRIRTSAASRSRWCRARRWRRPRRWSDQVAAILQQQPRGRERLSRASSSAMAASPRSRCATTASARAIEFERETRARRSPRSPTRASTSDRRAAGAAAAATMSITLGGDDPANCSTTAANARRRGYEGAAQRCVAPRDRGRSAAARNRDQAAARSRRRSGRHHRRRSARRSASRRWATSTRTARKFSLCDRQIPIRVALDQDSRAQPVDDREPAGADRERAARCR